jgi:hypothetical protein
MSRINACITSSEEVSKLELITFHARNALTPFAEFEQ